jgi:hypothetical protein
MLVEPIKINIIQKLSPSGFNKVWYKFKFMLFENRIEYFNLKSDLSIPGNIIPIEYITNTIINNNKLTLVINNTHNFELQFDDVITCLEWKNTIQNLNS